MSTTDLIRNEGFATVIQTLQELQARRRDLVLPASGLRMTSDGDTLAVPERNHEITEDGVTETVVNHLLDISDLAHDHLADKLSIPRRYYRLMDGDHSGLRATNVNHWFDNDSRKVMLRTYTNAEEGGRGLLRAVLSDRYAVIDNFDIAMATIDGIARAGIAPAEVNITGDITENGRLRMRVASQAIATNIGDILSDYRSPFNGRTAAELPLLFAGVEVTNSETGGGAFAITPRVVMQVCTNGMTQTTDIDRRVHLGGRLDEGEVQWSTETASKTLDLITSRARDAIATFMSVEYVEKVANRLRDFADRPVTPAVAVEVTTTALKLSDGEQSELLALFGASGQRTALGVGHAVTALAQSVGSERSAELEAGFMTVTEAAALASA